ncbi:MAG: hypothetical protein AAF660_04765 [Pseudomonadota bacterium]
MNDTTQSNNDEQFLDSYVAAARETVDNEAVADAAARFRQTLPVEKERTSFGWNPRFAAAAVLITGLAFTLSLFVPGGGGTAFADVQAWFSSYRTLDVQTAISLGDNEMVRVRVRADANGNTRIEQADTVHLLNVDNRTFSTLLPGNRYFDQPVDLYGDTDDGLHWVDKIRAFKGEAVALPETEIIRGRTVTGHVLLIDDINLILWSDASNNQPVLLEGELPGGLKLETHFDFDIEFAPELFYVPAGYEQVTPE